MASVSNAPLPSSSSCLAAAEQLFSESSTSILDYAEAVLKKDLNGSGQKLYHMWGKTTRKEFFMSNYQNENFRAAYAKQRFIVSGRCFLGALTRIANTCPEAANFLASGELQRVCSVGCGPGPDVAALAAFMRARDQHQRLVYFCVDQCPEWQIYLQQLDTFMSRRRAVSLWFKPMRFGDRESVELLPDADLIVFSFANTALMDARIWPEVVRRYRFVLVLDSIRDSLKDEYTDQGFCKFELANERTCCYYHIRNDDPKPDVSSVVAATTSTKEMSTAHVSLRPCGRIDGLQHISLRPCGVQGTTPGRPRLASDSVASTTDGGLLDNNSHAPVSAISSSPLPIKTDDNPDNV